MKHLLTILFLLTCATLHAQSVIVKGTGAGAVHATGAGSVAGVATPARFEVQANTNLVVDNDSGLMWTRDANIGGEMIWSNAVDYCDNLETNGYSDWRLPSITELSRDGTYGATDGLMDAYPSANNPALPTNHPFINIQFSPYWSSTLVEGFSDRARHVSKNDGLVGWGINTDILNVWPCRGP